MLTEHLSESTYTTQILTKFDKSNENQLNLVVETIRMCIDDYIHCCRLSLIIEHPNLDEYNKIRHSKIRMSDLKDFRVIFPIDIDDIKELNQFNYYSVPRISMPIYYFLYSNKPTFIEFLKSMTKLVVNMTKNMKIIMRKMNTNSIMIMIISNSSVNILLSVLLKYKDKAHQTLMEEHLIM